jgi:site-specific recombinase XerD
LNFANDSQIFNVGRKHFWTLFLRCSERAGIPNHKHHPHILKHSIAMHIAHSAGVENVRWYLGHQSLSSIGAYLKVNDSEASVAIARAQAD